MGEREKEPPINSIILALLLYYMEFIRRKKDSAILKVLLGTERGYSPISVFKLILLHLLLNIVKLKYFIICIDVWNLKIKNTRILLVSSPKCGWRWIRLV